jgi:YVTN family beta-propeller protein
VDVFDTATGNLVSVISVDGTFGGHVTRVGTKYVLLGGGEFEGDPEALYLSPDGSRLYATNIGMNSDIAVIDTATRKPIDAFDLGGGDHVTQLAFSPNGKTGYVATAAGGCSIMILDLASGSSRPPVKDTLGVGSSCGFLGVTTSLDGRRLYLADGLKNEIAVVDATVPLPNKLGSFVVTTQPERVQMAPDGKTLIVEAYGGLQLIKAAGNDGNVIVSFPAIAETHAFLDFRTSTLYATPFASNQVYVVDISRGVIVAQLPGGRYFVAGDGRSNVYFSVAGGVAVSTLLLKSGAGTSPSPTSTAPSTAVSSPATQNSPTQTPPHANVGWD